MAVSTNNVESADVSQRLTKTEWFKFLLLVALGCLILFLSLDIVLSWIYQKIDSNPWPAIFRLFVLIGAALLFASVSTWHLLSFSRRWRGIKFAVATVFGLATLPAIFFVVMTVIWAITGVRDAGWGLYVALVMVYIMAPIAVVTSIFTVAWSFLVPKLHVSTRVLAMLACVSIVLAVVYPTAYRPARSWGEWFRINNLNRQEEFTAEINRNPRDVDALMLRAEVRRPLHDWDGALEDYQRVLQLDPENVRALAGAAEMKKGAGETEEAIRLYTDVIGLAPEGWRSWAERGALYYEKGELDLAIPDFEQAFSLNDPKQYADYTYRAKCANAYFKRAQAHREADEIGQAIANYEGALAVAPSFWSLKKRVRYILEHRDWIDE